MLAREAIRTVLTLFLLCWHFPAASSLNLTVSPASDCSPDNGSPGLQCVEIDSALDQLESDVSIILEEGTHVIRRPHLSDTRGLSNIAIVGSGVEATFVTCENDIGLTFIGVENLLLSGFTVRGCGLTGDVNLGQPLARLEESLNLWITVPLSMQVALFVGDCVNVSMTDVHITGTSGLGMLGINLMGTSMLLRVNFTENVRPRCLGKAPTLPSFITPDIFDQVGGGAYFLYMEYNNTSSELEIMDDDEDEDDDEDDEKNEEHSLVVIDSNFSHNADCTYTSTIAINFPFYTYDSRGLYSYAVGGGGGVSVVLASSSFGTSVTFSRVTFTRNDARYGGGAYVATFAGVDSAIVHFHECRFVENGVPSLTDVDSNSDGLGVSHCKGGGGLAVFADLVKPEHLNASIPTASPNRFVNLIVSDSHFVRNRAEIQGGAVMAYSLFNTPHANQDISSPTHYSIVWAFTETDFVENLARYGSAAYFKQMVSFGFSGSALLLLQGVDVSRNFHDSSNSADPDEEACAVSIKSVTCTVTGRHNAFVENQGSGLRIQSSLVLLTNDSAIVFKRNVAHRGGGIFLTGNSPTLSFSPGSRAEFVENSAVIEGGAIYTDMFSTPPEILQPVNLNQCFFAASGYIDTENPDGDFGLFSSNVTISFANNTAPLGGVVYGSSLEMCAWAGVVPPLEGLSFYEALQSQYPSTFDFSNAPTGLTQFSTLPAYLDVTLLLSDEDEEKSNDDDDDDEKPINPIITIFPGQMISIGIEVFDAYGNVIPAVVTSSVVGGRDVSARSILGSSGFWHTSVYESNLRVTGSYEGVLNISIITETSSLSSWFLVNLTACPTGFSTHMRERRCICDEALLSLPNVRCYEDIVSLGALENTWIGVDNFNSSSLVVHRCILNYCKAFGFNNTIHPPHFDSQCDFNRSGLLCGNCAPGLSHVFGTNDCKECSNYWLFLIPAFALAGAILFAVVALLGVTIDKGVSNVFVLFSSLISFYDFLSPNVIITQLFLPFRFLGLQIGLGVCFYDGMTALERSFIALLFPAYLFVLMGLFTVLCRRLSWLSMYFSPIKTLATLMVLCYFSLLTTSVDFVIPTRVDTIDGRASFRWLVDPNVKYFNGAHGVLGTMGILILAFYIAPLPIVLLFPSLAYRHLQRLVPFLDVLLAAYKPKFRFWMGVRILLVVVIFPTTRAPLTITYAICGSLMVAFCNLQTCLQPFREKWVNYAETFLFTLLIVCFWGAEVVNELEFTPGLEAFTIIVLVIFAILAYSAFLFLLGLHFRAQFHSLWPRLRLCCARLCCRCRKSEAQQQPVDQSVVVMTAIDDDDENDGDNDGSSDGIKDSSKTKYDLARSIVTRSSVSMSHTLEEGVHPEAVESLSVLPSPMAYPRRVAGVPRYRESLLDSSYYPQS